ncbi:hypothetical protein K5_094 [Pseudomonas phage K5]|uniref:Uncharacterized protein n=7 Tax=Pakpunavirus TaxID=1921407 RepID=K4RM52_9CAUD|nr:hypothetical protein PaP1_gp083 [Pseudomonas phage PaP1]YP_007236910.1 hypothetical protein BN405_2-10_Ab1_orf_89 [Pseudomonas phage vB_PaeM_C2-10_Ab1]YP_008857085.1 hypothetical protein X831_gp045 [Pseudomonas phage PAK_P2]YP_009200031.1 hypothetical protein K8_095 [Pseudomonas phage K8]YP_009273849.1 hypothetical protein BH773_gp134 [Pseudomonas phage K5]YP_009291147.1 hypothetical protein BI047_gp111 [Pseudomonas phage phiMK]YP_010765157.1 hypothetical protein QE347_gp049 [Pseudomonas p
MSEIMKVEVGDRVVLKAYCDTYTGCAKRWAQAHGRLDELLATGFVEDSWVHCDDLAGGLKGTVVMTELEECCAVRLDAYTDHRAVVVVDSSDLYIACKAAKAPVSTLDEAFGCDHDYLMDSPANAQRLNESVEQLRTGQVVEVDVPMSVKQDETPPVVVHVVEKIYDRKGNVHLILQYEVAGALIRTVVEQGELIYFLDEMQGMYLTKIQLEVNNGVV